MRKLSLLLALLLFMAGIGTGGAGSAYAATDYTAIYAEMQDSYPELVDRMENGEHPVTEDQILNFLADLASEVEDSGTLTTRNFDGIMYASLKNVLFEDGEIGMPVVEHFDFALMLLTEFSEEVTDALDEGTLSGDLEDLSDSIKSILLGDDAPAAGGGGGGLTADEPEDGGIYRLSLESRDFTIEVLDGARAATFNISNGALSDIFALAGNDATIIAAPKVEAEAYTAMISGTGLSKLANRNASLRIETGIGNFTIPAGALPLEQAIAALGAPGAGDVMVSMSIASVGAESIQAINDPDAGIEAVLSPVEFHISCSYMGKTITIDSFDAIIAFEIPLQETTDASGITTIVVFDDAGKLQHIPTLIETEEDSSKYIAFGSMNSSIFAAIHHEKQFADTERHWGKADIQDMASRMIINGVTEESFEPDRAITRAEFMTIVVRGLGLMRTGMGSDAFDDVESSDWYYDAVSIAKIRGIAGGVGNGTFAPDQPITREEAMTMIARASAIAGMEANVTEQQMAAAFSNITDSAQVSYWARQAAAVCLRTGIIVGDNGAIDPQDAITRAETAAIVKRMLSKAGRI